MDPDLRFKRINRARRCIKCHALSYTVLQAISTLNYPSIKNGQETTSGNSYPSVIPACSLSFLVLWACIDTVDVVDRFIMFCSYECCRCLTDCVAEPPRAISLSSIAVKRYKPQWSCGNHIFLTRINDSCNGVRCAVFI